MSLSTNNIKLPVFKSFEQLSMMFDKPSPFLLISVYRPPGSPTAFLNDFQKLLDNLSVSSLDTVIVG
jgi:hypothetical protein